jgi:hypothetical protein
MSGYVADLNGTEDLENPNLPKRGFPCNYSNPILDGFEIGCILRMHSVLRKHMIQDTPYYKLT